VLAFYIGAMEYYAGVFERNGYRTEVRNVSEAWSREREAAHRHVTDELLDSVAIAGSPEWGRERLADYRDLGVDVPILALPTLASAELRRSTLEALAPG
jgi:alkanesulfonate monooxygenase SsuD/methylene tetrahydromethanopterin reductase-like flavin-dependent oxidoreductase (luciferase family)